MAASQHRHFDENFHTESQPACDRAAALQTVEAKYEHRAALEWCAPALGRRVLGGYPAILRSCSPAGGPGSSDQTRHGEGYRVQGRFAPAARLQDANPARCAQRRAVPPVDRIPGILSAFTNALKPEGNNRTGDYGEYRCDSYPYLNSLKSHREENPVPRNGVIFLAAGLESDLLPDGFG